MVSAIGLAVGIAAMLQWFPRTKAAWGLGPHALRHRASAVAEALGDKDPGSMHSRLDAGERLWVSESRANERTLAVVLDPEGRLIYARRSPSKLAAEVQPDALWGWLQSLAGSLPSDIGRLTSSRKDGGEIEGSLVRPDGVTLSVRTPHVAVATPVELMPAGGPPRIHSPMSLPLGVSIAVMMVMAALAIPMAWDAVLQGRARPGMSAPLGIAATAAAFLGCVVMFVPGGGPGAPVSAIIAVAGAVGAAVLVGQVLEASRPRIPPLAQRQEIRAGWALSGSALGLASLCLLFPFSAAPSLAGTTVAGLSAIGAILLGIACGLGIEMGMRPIADTVFASAGAPLRLGVMGIVAGLTMAPLIPGPWWWAILCGAVAGVISGIVSQRFGRKASAVLVAVYFTGMLVLPGLATSLLNGVLSVAAISVVAGVAPALASRYSPARVTDPSETIPAYVQAIKDRALRTYDAEMAASLQIPLCVTSPAQERGIEVGCVQRRACPPAADICRIIGVGRDRVGVLMGEVPGVGVHGSVQASILSVATLAAAADARNIAVVPAEVERLISAAWSGGADTVCMSYGVLDRRSKTFSCVNAGGQPVLLYRALAGRFERILPPGEPLRTAASEGKRTHEIVTLQLVTKDLLVFFSDGLLSVPVPGGFFSLDHIERLVLANSGASCDEMARLLDEELARLLGASPPSDDIVVLFLRGK